MKNLLVKNTSQVLKIISIIYLVKLSLIEADTTNNNEAIKNKIISRFIRQQSPTVLQQKVEVAYFQFSGAFWETQKCLGSGGEFQTSTSNHCFPSPKRLDPDPNG